MAWDIHHRVRSAGGKGRREVLAGLMALFASRATFTKGVSQNVSKDLPATVAGIAIPRTSAARAATALSRQACPEVLFNHCMRTFLFGALHENHHGRSYDSEAAFVAAALHDLGLLQAYETEGRPFEIDSANAAEHLALQNGLSPQVADLVWNAAAMHDMRWAIVTKQNPTVELVAAGASADVVGPDETMISPAATAEVLDAFPRLGFKAQFARLLTDHCRRKPLSQLGTWLDGYCRAAAPGAKFPDPAALIRAAPFSE
jgi:HD domain